MKRRIEFGEDEELLNLIPLIDCLFILIVFLVTALTFKEKIFKPVKEDEKQSLGIELPVSKNHETIKLEDPLVIEVKSNGDYYIKEKKYNSEALGAFFILQGKKEDAIVVYGDKKCPYDKIVYLTDLARSYGINYIAFYVQPSDKKTEVSEVN